MAGSSHILTFGTFVSAFIGACFGVFLDRLLRRAESVPLFRIQLGIFQDVAEGDGITLTAENVGLQPIPEYRVVLFHPDRGSLEVFHGDRGALVFPQYPQQKNEFRCAVTPRRDTERQQSFLKGWFLRAGGAQVDAPLFAEFKLRLVLRNSDCVLFEDGGLGNSLAKQIYERVSGQILEQKVEDVFYRSKAPFWVELVRKYRLRRMIRDVEKGKVRASHSTGRCLNGAKRQ